MATLWKDQGNTAVTRTSKPSLTIDTGAPPKPGVDLGSSQSAPVGTRQEKGMPPMYQYADRYCARVSEMMNTSNWRSQRPGPAVVDGSGSYSPIADRGYVQSSDHQSENNSDSDNCSSHAEWLHQEPHNVTDEVNLGRDGEAMSILGIHPFLEEPGTPGSSADTFLISAAVGPESTPFAYSALGEMHAVRIMSRRRRISSKSAEDEGVGHHTQTDVYMSDSKESAHNSLDSSDHVRARKQINDEEILVKEEVVNEKVRDIHELMGRDEAIESVNFEHVSPRRRHPATPEEERRFRCLLGRLEPRRAIEQKKDTTLMDPAIISFAPKKQGEGYGGGNLMAQLRAAEEKYLEENKRHNRSDSGYASPTTNSKPSTRTQSRSRQDGFDDATAETLSIQHQKFRSKDSGYESLSKQSVLNPAAKEFSASKVVCGSPTKQDGFARPPVSGQFYSPPQELRINNTYFTPARPGAAFQSQGLGFNDLSNHITTPMNLATTPRLVQAPPRILSQINDFPSTSLPPPSGYGFPGSLPIIRGPPEPFPGFSHPLGLGMPVVSPTPNLASMPGLVAPARAGPFHHQLPPTASCNNPAHHSISPFGSAHVSPVPAIAPLPPPAPPASLVPQVTTAQLPPPVATAAPPAAPFIRKKVPKPKVPNTLDQQYWEYVHEMRRTYEPGYAQKSKTNQQKRFMKQTHKIGDAVGRS